MIKRTNLVATLAGASLAVFALALAGPPAASAAFTPDQLACRTKISKDGSKLANLAAKEMLKCHKLRVSGKLDAMTNCNDVTAVDTKGKIAKAATKLVDDANSNCSGFTPADLNYTGCPNPCDATVPVITTFQNVADCIVCVVEDHAEQVSFTGQGNPTPPLNSTDAKCHGAIGKGATKLTKTIVKERTKCQQTAESEGAMDTASCISSDAKGKIAKADSKGRASVAKLCADADITSLDSCSFFSLSALQDCVFEEARIRGRLTFKSFYELAPGGGITTTTEPPTSTTSTTTTTMPGGPQDPLCPNLGELTLLAGTGDTCTTNGDCLAGTCGPTGTGPRCITVTDLDTGWTGISHDADINDHAVTLGNLLCTGPGPVCGECTILGLNPATRTCRCESDNRTICDEPFVADADDCGGGICACYFGGPLPLSAGNTPACVVNRFAVDVSGTANVDLGAGSVEAHLRSQVFLGESLTMPCPACGGTCTAGLIGQTCTVDAHCETSPGAADGTCGNLDPIPNDGVRGGTCHLGRNPNLACDIDSPNTSFPAPGGGGNSLDCFPKVGLNVSGQGLKIDITQTTGSSSLTAAVPCGQPPIAPRTCPCGQCSNDNTIPCTSDSDCTGPGTCGATGSAAFPNSCTGETCADTGDGKEGECSTGPDTLSCDAIVRSNGEGFISCNSNADCDPNNIGVAAGNCTLVKRLECFLDPIIAEGAPDPTSPVGAAIFCIPKTANNGINTVAGLPGPGRVINQGSSRTFCANDNNVQYQPGIGGCP